MPAAEFMEWIKRYQRDPWGVQRDNFHAAIIAQQVAAAPYAPRKGKIPAISKFMLSANTAKPKPKPKTDDQLSAHFEALAMAGVVTKS